MHIVADWLIVFWHLFIQQKNSDAQKGKVFFPIVQFVRQFNQMWALVSLQMPVVTLSIESF